MDHEDGCVVIQDENDLQQAVCASRAPDEVLVIGPTRRVGGSSMGDHLFGLVRINTVFREMLDVPVIPAKLHLDSTSELTKG
jgi:hypothetical protein